VTHRCVSPRQRVFRRQDTRGSPRVQACTDAPANTIRRTHHPPPCLGRGIGCRPRHRCALRTVYQHMGCNAEHGQTHCTCRRGLHLHLVHHAADLTSSHTHKIIQHVSHGLTAETALKLAETNQRSDHRPTNDSPEAVSPSWREVTREDTTCTATAAAAPLSTVVFWEGSMGAGRSTLGQTLNEGWSHHEYQPRQGGATATSNKQHNMTYRCRQSAIQTR
jgi:hypothetical protein